jgi:clan AA aspartic protease (TIGR02281 family)
MYVFWNRKMKPILLFIVILVVLVSSSYGEMYKWVDEKGTVHFTDDISNIPEKYHQNTETRKPPKETSAPQIKETPVSPVTPERSEFEGFEVKLLRKHELWMAEVLLNGSVRREFIVDTGASFSLISWETARELGITIDENTPFIPGSTVSGVILSPLVTLRSMRVGDAELENVEVSIYDMPSGGGLLGNSFLNRFKVTIDSLNEKMTLSSMQGKPSQDRPGGYGRDYWEGRIRFYNRVLDELKKIKRNYEGRGGSSPELIRVNNAIRYFENQLSELERKASFAGVPRNWRQ